MPTVSLIENEKKHRARMQLWCSSILNGPEYETSWVESEFGIEQILKIVNLVSPARNVLDVGCGDGKLGAFFKTKGSRVVGVDINPEAVEKARKRLDQAVLCDVEAEDFPNEKYDVVLFHESLEHTRNPARVLLKAQKVLKPDGFLVVTVPNIAFIKWRIWLLLGRIPEQDMHLSPDRPWFVAHVFSFTEDSLKKLLRDMGFHIQYFYGYWGPRLLWRILSRVCPRLFAFTFVSICRPTEVELRKDFS